MNAEELYEHIKDALTFFGLSFHQKDQMKVSIADNFLVLSHGLRSVAVKVEEQS